MIRTREEWYKHCQDRGTWGEQVYQILDDWEESDELIKKSILEESVKTRQYIEDMTDKIKLHIGELC